MNGMEFDRTTLRRGRSTLKGNGRISQACNAGCHPTLPDVPSISLAARAIDKGQNSELSTYSAGLDF